MVDWSLPLHTQLQWCLNSPQLIPSTPRLTLGPLPDDFDVDGTIPPLATLEAFCEEHGHWRVGLHFETLITCWLTHHPRLELISRNLQVFHAARTLGAFDFLIRTDRQALEHWEVAIKFYLLDGDVHRAQDWMGPNRRDRLDIKVDRMADHQLPLSSHPAGRERIASLGLEGYPLSTRALLKGILFHPMGLDGPASQTPCWFRQSDMLQTKPLEELVWQPRHKPDWIGPASTPTSELISDRTFRSVLKSRRVERPEMWSLCRPDGTGRLIEENRCFLVQDTWGTLG